MKNYEYTTSDNDYDRLRREELVDRYLGQRDMSYDKLVRRLEKRGGQLVFHDSEKLTQLAAEFTAGAAVEFSEQMMVADYQSGVLVEDAFLVPVSSIDHPQHVYRPQLCATIQDVHGVIDTLLFPIRRHVADETYQVMGLRIYANGLPAS